MLGHCLDARRMRHAPCSRPILPALFGVLNFLEQHYIHTCLRTSSGRQRGRGAEGQRGRQEGQIQPSLPMSSELYSCSARLLQVNSLSNGPSSAATVPNPPKYSGMTHFVPMNSKLALVNFFLACLPTLNFTVPFLASKLPVEYQYMGQVSRKHTYRRISRP